MKRVNKKLVSRIMAVCLMLVMVLSMGMAVSAAPLTPDAEDSITISGIETDDSGNGIGTLNAYRVINVNVNKNQPQAPVYTWDGAVAEWVSRNFRSYIDIDNSNAVTDAFLDLSDQSDDEAQAELKTFVDRLANAIRYTEGEDEDTAITITPAYEIDLSQQVPTGGKKAITADVSLGAYLFLVEGGVRIYSPGFAAVYPVNENGSWVPEGQKVDVTLKSEKLGIDKTVSDYTYEIGQSVTYTQTVNALDYRHHGVNNKVIFADYLIN